MSQNYKNSDWRYSIIAQLRAKSSDELIRLKDMINQNDRLRKENVSVKALLEKQIEKMSHAALLSKNGEATKLNYEILMLKQTLQEANKDIISLKEINAKQIDDISQLRSDKTGLVSSLNAKTESIDKLTTKIDELESTISELKNLNNFFKTSWALAREENDSFKDKCITLEEKCRKCLDENHVFEEHIKFLKLQIESITKNESFLLLNCQEADKLPDVITHECEEAINLEQYSYINCPKEQISFSENYYSTPSRLYLKFNAHENEIQSVCWAPHDNILATGGFDRDIKLWNISFAHPYNFKTLIGSSGIINSIQFNSVGSHILAACGDSAARIWSIQNENPQATLTGHSKKVFCAKFLDSSIKKAITGSRDGTIKFWDVNNLLCFDTKSVNSTCHDLVVNDAFTCSIISGHFDKKLRFWDMRQEQHHSNIEMQDIITSLDISKDRNSLLCSVRNNTLNIIDLRYNKIMKTFSENDFTIDSNLTKASFNALGNKVSSGSGNGSVYIWDAIDGMLDTELPVKFGNTRSRKSSINSISWHPVNSVLATAGNSSECKIWS